MSFALSLAFPERHSKPIAAALREYISRVGGLEKMTIDTFGFSPLVNIGIKLIETGQLDVLLTSVGSSDNGSMILGIKVPGGPQFPEQFQQMLERLKSFGLIEADRLTIAADSVNAIPVHRISYNVLGELFGSEDDNTDPSSGHLSLVATPDAIWFATSGKDNPSFVPDLLKLAVDQASSKSPNLTTSASRKVLPFRLTFHSREIKFSESTPPSQEEEKGSKVRQAKGEAAGKVQQAKLEQEKKAQAELEVIKSFFQEKEDAVHAELRPTATGFKLTVQLEEAFVALFGRLMTEMLDDNENE